MSHESWLNPSDWERATRGRNWDFTAPTTGIIAALLELATRNDDQLSLLSCERVRQGQAWISVYERHAPDELTLEGPWAYFIQSRAATPVIPPTEAESLDWGRTFAVNGLLSLNHPEPGHGSAPIPISSIGLVNRVAHRRTHQVVEHVAYDRLFRQLKSLLKRAAPPS